MTSDNYVSVKCPRCGHEWNAKLNDQPANPVYRGVDPVPATREYRVKCPQDGTQVVVSVEIREEQAGDG